MTHSTETYNSNTNDDDDGDSTIALHPTITTADHRENVLQKNF